MTVRVGSNSFSSKNGSLEGVRDGLNCGGGGAVRLLYGSRTLGRCGCLTLLVLVLCFGDEVDERRGPKPNPAGYLFMRPPRFVRMCVCEEEGVDGEQLEGLDLEEEEDDLVRTYWLGLVTNI